MIISGLSLFGTAQLKKIIDKWIVLLTIAYTKYLNFVLLDTLVTILDENNIDILSNSFIMTSIFVLYDSYVFIVTDFIGFGVRFLIFTQIIFGIVIIISFIIILCKSKK